MWWDERIKGQVRLVPEFGKLWNFLRFMPYLICMKILIVEDETRLLSLMSSFLKEQGFLCETAATYGEGLSRIRDNYYDIVLLDIGLPGGSGLSLIQHVRDTDAATGIIVISARDSLDDKISGLDLGADDYLTKPFQLPELNSRINSLLRRRQFGGTSVLRHHEIQLDPAAHLVTVNGREIPFTRKEFDLLLFFMTNPNRVLSRESIAEHLWEDDVDLADNFDFIYTHLNNIRKKIKSAGGRDSIRSIYGIGYKLVDE